MGRSVATHSNAVETVYLYNPAGYDESNYDEQYPWEDFIEYIQSILKEKFKSF